MCVYKYIKCVPGTPGRGGPPKPIAPRRPTGLMAGGGPTHTHTHTNVYTHMTCMCTHCCYTYVYTHAYTHVHSQKSD